MRQVRAAGDSSAAPPPCTTRAAYGLLTSRDVARLLRCAGCPWLFLDRSKNASRRWCSMQDCGTHEKIQRYVTRRQDDAHPAGHSG